MKEVYKDVETEPILLPLANANMVKGNSAENICLDVSGIGVCSPMERPFLDIPVMHPNYPSCIKKDIKTIKREKKRAYVKRVNQVENVSLTSFVMSTSS